MSDLFEVRQKVEEGANWRGSITVSIGGEQQELTVRQLRDTEFWEVMSLIDTDEIEDLQSDLPEEEMEEFRDLQSKDDLTDGESDRLAELQDELEDTTGENIFEELSFDTFKGIKKCAKYGVEPDDADIQRALTDAVGEIRDTYGGGSHEEARQYVQDTVIDPTIENSTNFTSFAIGVRVLGETLEGEGN